MGKWQIASVDDKIEMEQRLSYSSIGDWGKMQYL
jgi:hypothetical protein